MKITGLYETHIFVSSLEQSIDFYTRVMGLPLAHIEEDRRVAFLWIEKEKQSMLGLWEKPQEEIELRHFAFRCDVRELLENAVPFLKSNGLQPYNLLKDGTDRPMVFAWIPAVAIYFTDPDGHYLEYLGLLEGKARADLGVISYEEWLEKTS
ncbi:MAG: VOC family protein [Saprospiraceae bacterium]